MKLHVLGSLLAMLLAFAAPACAVPVTFEMRTLGDIERLERTRGVVPTEMEGRAAPAWIRIVLDLDSVVNLDYSFYFHPWNGEPTPTMAESHAGALISAKGRGGKGLKEVFDGSAYFGVRITTDANGILTGMAGNIQSRPGPLSHYLNFNLGSFPDPFLSMGNGWYPYYSGTAVASMTVRGHHGSSAVTVPAPVPVPASLPLLGAALAAIGALRLRRNGVA